MEGPSSSQQTLVALGAALGSNCVSCMEYPLPEARRAGLSDRQMNQAVRLADKVRRVPARKVLDTALDLLAEAAGTTAAERKTREHRVSRLQIRVSGGIKTVSRTRDQRAPRNRVVVSPLDGRHKG